MFRLLLILALLFPLPVLAAPQLGSLRVRVSDDFTSRSASVNYLLRTALSNFVSLPASLFDDVEIVPGGMYSYDPDAQSLVLEDSDDLNSSAETQFSTLTLRVNFQNKDVSCSEDKLSNILQESKRNVSDWFSEASYGSDFFQFDSDSSGSADIVTVSINASTSDSCDYQSWSDAADIRAQAQGVVLSNYTNIIYVFPSSITCEWGGLGEFGCGSDCRAWIALCDNNSVYTHELGHNLGVDHAASDLNDDGVDDDEYGDESCPMGTAAVGFRHFNVPHKFQLGWLPSSLASGISEDSFVTLAASELPLDEESETLRAIRVFINPSQPLAGRYYFSFRTPLGEFSEALKSPYLKKVNIHRSRDLSGRTSYISSLSVDESWSDEEGRRVTFSDFSDSKATVWVSPDNNEQPNFAVSGTVTLKNGKTPQKNLLKKVSLVFKKLSSKKKTKVKPADDGTFQGALTYGQYKIRLKPKKGAPIKVLTKPTTLLISEDSANLEFKMKKKKS